MNTPVSNAVAESVGERPVGDRMTVESGTKINVRFHENPKEYTFICDFPVKENDLAVVYTNGHHSVVRVVAVGVNFYHNIELKSVIDIVNTERYFGIRNAKRAIVATQAELRRGKAMDWRIQEVTHQTAHGEIDPKAGKKLKKLFKKIKKLAG